MEQPGRYYAGTPYRYGYQGMEQDTGATPGDHFTTFFRQYDARLGRWWGIDPVTNPSESPYAAMSNNPITLVDPSGAQGDTTSSPLDPAPRTGGTPGWQAWQGQMPEGAITWINNIWAPYVQRGIPIPNDMSPGRLQTLWDSGWREGISPYTNGSRNNLLPAIAATISMPENRKSVLYYIAAATDYLDWTSAIFGHGLIYGMLDQGVVVVSSHVPDFDGNVYPHHLDHTYAWSDEQRTAHETLPLYALGPMFRASGAALATRSGIIAAEAEASTGGVATTGQAPAHVAGIHNINPGYPSAPGTTTNCANCAIATDLTWEGLPSSAVPSGETSVEYLAQRFGPVNSIGDLSAVERAMIARGTGARAIVMTTIPGEDVGHAFNAVVNKGGVVKFWDGQINSRPRFDLMGEHFWLIFTN